MNMNLKDKLSASFLAFESNYGVDTNENLHQIRTHAMDQFEKVGFPAKKNEDWKYTSVKKFLDRDYSLFPIKTGNVTHKDIEKLLLKGTETYKIVFVDGVFQTHLSDVSHDQLDVCILSSAIKKPKYQIVFNHYFNTVASQEEGFSSLNTAFASEGAYIHIPKGKVVEKPIQILYITTDKEKEVLLQPRNLIIVDENAHVQIIEQHHSFSDNFVLNNTLTEIFANKRAVVDFYKIQNDNIKASLVDNTFVQQKEGSNVTVNTYTFGGDMTRNNLSFYQVGENINSNLNGVTMVKGKSHVDNQTNVYHQQPNCESHELYKGIYDEASTGVFNGKVYVEPIAQKTDAFQQNDNILLTDDASINSKPQLEIFADDVACSHGCTIGELDKDAMFYLKQRGIPSKEAKALLLFAFTNEVVKRIRIPQLKQAITDIISEKLGVELEIEM